MIDHVTIKVSDLGKSKSFYEEAFKPLGYKLSFGNEETFWAFDVGSGCLFEIEQDDSKKSICHPVHVAFRVPNRVLVHKFYEAAMDLGAKDNGKPGPRPEYTENYYACFILDPDGHNIEAMCDI